MTCPKCGATAGEPATECPRCGVVFGRLHQSPPAPSRPTPVAAPRRKSGPHTIAALALIILAWWILSPHSTDAGWNRQAAGYDKAIAEQGTNKHSILLYFYTGWCPHCRDLDRNYFAKTEFHKRFTDLIKVKVNPERGEAEEQLARKYGVTGYPSLFVLENGRYPRKIPFYREPEDLFAALTGRYPADPVLNGYSLLEEGKSEAAQAEFDRAARQQPNDPEPHYWAGVALQKQGQTMMATLEFEKAVKIRPHAPSYDYLAWLALEKHDWIDAQQYATKIIEIDPSYDKGRAYELRGLAYAGLGKDYEAGRDFSAACARGDEEACRERSIPPQQ